MADLVIGDGRETDHNSETGELQTVATTVYVIGWAGDDQPKSPEFYKDELRVLRREADDSDF